MKMTSCSDNPKNSNTALRSACFALAGLAFLISPGDKALAARLFDATRLGMRVIVAPTDTAPVEIAHPNLFHSKSEASALAATRVAEAAEAAKKADQARLAAVAAARDAARAMMPVRVAE